ncbi:MAG: hypothetical protein QOF63_4323, partial [Thermoanaerobaculia bacterium]|nr:hypothetical protein [Thermoanaerobaculia bacterium]
ILAHFSDPFADPRSILGRATSRVLYDLFAYSRSIGESSRKPAAVYTLQRETHSHSPGRSRTKLQHAFLYSDGFQREIQIKTQAEPGPAPRRDQESGRLVIVDGSVDSAPADPRWVGTGRTIYNNKGLPVKKYEPFFSSIHGFESEPEMAQTGVTPVIHYDPLQRAIRTDLPDGTFTTLDFNPWRLVTADVNDNVLASRWYAERRRLPLGDPERRAADLAAQHAGTPAVGHFDTLGRAFLVELDNGSAGKRRSLHDRDIQGNTRSITDSLGRPVVINEFDLLQHTVRTISIDSGEKRYLLNVAGKPLLTWDSRGHEARSRFDSLQRPTHLFVRKGNGTPVLAERSVYGERHPDATALNLRGKIFQQFHGAGLTTSDRYDFKGNPASATRRMAGDCEREADWSPLSNLNNVDEIAAAAESLLEDETFRLGIAYDALNRPIHLTAPDRSEIRTSFNEASLPDRIEGQLRGTESTTTFVSNVGYNARRQRTRIRYGNDVRTDYDYDPKTFRLARMRTMGAASSVYLQDLTYTYDPIGNITSIRDAAQQTSYFDNQVVSANSEFQFDALYQLVAATGREHLGQNGSPSQPGPGDGFTANQPHPADGSAMGNYLERYRFDDAGNILSVSHTASSGNWTRRYDYDCSNNRLRRTSLPADGDGEFSATYRYDAHGNMTAMPHLAEMDWDFKDQLQELDLGGGGRVHHAYDAAGQRVRKVWRKSASLVMERLYLGPFEIVRCRNEHGILFERQTLMVMDGLKRIVIVETKTVHEGEPPVSPVPLMRYQFENHLGSSSLELDEAGALITYEEYFPWGSTSFRSTGARAEASRKPYRYQAKERDEETGLDYFGARYYVSWLGRWTSPDPAGLADGLNPYRFTRNNPIVLTDPNGALSVAPTPSDGDDKLTKQVTDAADKYLQERLEVAKAAFPNDYVFITQNSILVVNNGVASLNVTYTVSHIPLEVSGPENTDVKQGKQRPPTAKVFERGSGNFMARSPENMPETIDAPPEQESLPVRALETIKEGQEVVEHAHEVAEAIPKVKRALEPAGKGKFLKGILKGLKVITHKAVGPILEGVASIAKGIETKSVKPIVHGAGSIAGGLAGGAIGEVVGGAVGAVVLGAIGGVLLGPAGVVAGVWLGEIVGTLVGGYLGETFGSDLGGKAADFLFDVFTEKLPAFYDQVMNQVGQTLNFIGDMIRGEERGYRWFYVQ